MRTLRNILLYLSVSLLLCAQAHANDGNMLLECVESEDPLMQVAAEAYITGAYSMGVTLGIICPVDGVTHDQLVATVILFVIENPALRHLEATMLVGASLMVYFPCAEEEPGVDV